MHTNTIEKLGKAKDQFRQHRLESRLERTQEEAERLREENRALAEALEETRDERGDLLESLEKSVGKKKRGPRIFRWIVVGGAAYLLGAKAGRKRYDQFQAWFRNTWNKVAPGRDFDFEEITENAGHAVDEGVRAAKETAEKIKKTA